MPDKVLYMGSLSLLLALFSFYIVAAPRFSDNVKLAMAFLATGFILALDKAFVPHSFWSGSDSANKLAIAGMFVYGTITFISVNLGTRWWDKQHWRFNKGG